MNKSYYEQSNSYHLETMEQKRAAILWYLTDIWNASLDSTGWTNKAGYFKTELLEKEIAFVMGWVKEVAGRLHCENQVVLDMNQYGKVQRTLLNMDAKGYIKLSKSRRGFKILNAIA